jgi:hypothetical protein
MNRFYIFFIAFLFAGSCIAQSVTSVGDCNANITGSGNNVVIQCVGGQTSTSKSHLLVFTRDNFPMMEIMNVNPNFIDRDLSDISFYIDNKRVFSQYFDESFQDTSLHLSEGDYHYKIKIDLWYLNSHNATVNCSGILTIKASAAIIPRILVRADPGNGSLYPVACRLDPKTG